MLILSYENLRGPISPHRLSCLLNDPNNNGTRSGDQLEAQIESILQEKAPCAYLSCVPVFRSDAATLPNEMANELDFILHLQTGKEHTLLIIECKSCRITGPDDTRGGFKPIAANQPWIAHYPQSDRKQKNIKNQLHAQRKALLSNLEPLDGIVRVAAIVVATQVEGLKPGTELRHEDPAILEISLVTPNMFANCLHRFLSAKPGLRVQQSEILRRIRMGQPVSALGHPEIYHAIEYSRRCRAFIDSEIFRHLDFTQERWAINGSAGMGKSVLLTCAVMALITDRIIHLLGGELRILQTFTEDAAKLGLPPLHKRRVWVAAHTAKQRDMLKAMFERFNALYTNIDPYNEYRRVKPEFHVFSDIAKIECNVLLVDEAHDLSPESEQRIRDWYSPAEGRYLVIACDRHQKLRLSRDATRMIEGINFSRCTKKLNRNYRNPFATYAASLGLLFRWFAVGGPNIIPETEELKESFGFEEVRRESSGMLYLYSRNDAHPANNWSHLVASFSSAEAAFHQLSESPLRKDHVLWVRFGPESLEFDYEQLQRWSYHNVSGRDAAELLNKYVKGQEFPIVVVEGLPDCFSYRDAFTRHSENQAEASHHMWLARRLVYLAASRANVFLYFILPTAMDTSLDYEFKNLFAQLSEHPPQWSPAGKRWELRVPQTQESEKLPAYLDHTEIETSFEIRPPAELPVPAPAPEISAVSPQTAVPPPVEAPVPVAVAESTLVVLEPVPIKVSVPVAIEIPTGNGTTEAGNATDPAPKVAVSGDAEAAKEFSAPVATLPKEIMRVTVIQLAKQYGITVQSALETLKKGGFPALKPNTMVKASLGDHLKNAKAELGRNRPLQTIQIPQPTMSGIKTDEPPPGVAA